MGQDWGLGNPPPFFTLCWEDLLGGALPPPQGACSSKWNKEAERTSLQSVWRSPRQGRHR